jgi:hypothetical protein
MDYELNDFELTGDALDELREAFGKEYDMSGPELDCDLCGSFGYCECDCESSDLERF